MPFTISWSAASDPSGIIAYNWQLSTSASFAVVPQQNSTSGQTQDIVSGVAPGTYYWRVQAVNGSVTQGAWSATRSVVITGTNADSPGTAVLNPPKGATAFHPMESIHFTWSAVPGAVSYNFDASTDPNFPVATRVHFDNIPNPSYSIVLGDSMPEGLYYVQITALNANRISGIPSNKVTFTLSFNAPLPPAPTPLQPANGATVTLPVTLTWTDVPNPQESGYVLVVSRDAGFSSIEYGNNQITGPQWSITSLSAGTKYWRVLSTQGDSAPGVPANTAWSATRSFVVPSTTGMGSLSLSASSPFSGDNDLLTIQLTGPAPANGAVVSLTSSHPALAPMPATYTVASGFAFDQFWFKTGQVTTDTLVTLTATLNGTSASLSFTLQPPSLKWLTVGSPLTGGVLNQGIVMLNGQAPPSGLTVSLTSGNPALAGLPATVNIAPGSPSVLFTFPTGEVTANTTIPLSATMNGLTVQTQLTLTPQQPPASLELSPTTTGSNGSSFGTVRLSAAAPGDTQLFLTSSHPSLVQMSQTAQVPQGTTAGGFNIFVGTVTTTTTVTITVTGAGVSRSATLTIQP